MPTMKNREDTTRVSSFAKSKAERAKSHTEYAASKPAKDTTNYGAHGNIPKVEKALKDAGV